MHLDALILADLLDIRPQHVDVERRAERRGLRPPGNGLCPDGPPALLRSRVIRPFLGALVAREEQRRQDADDGDDHEQFDEGKPLLMSASHIQLPQSKRLPRRYSEPVFSALE